MKFLNTFLNYLLTHNNIYLLFDYVSLSFLFLTLPLMVLLTIYILIQYYIKLN